MKPVTHSHDKSKDALSKVHFGEIEPTSEIAGSLKGRGANTYLSTCNTNNVDRLRTDGPICNGLHPQNAIGRAMAQTQISITIYILLPGIVTVSWWVVLEIRLILTIESQVGLPTPNPPRNTRQLGDRKIDTS